MSLRQNLEIALNQQLLAFNQSPSTLSVQDSSGHLTLEIDFDKIESLGCLISELRFKCLTSKTNFSDLQEWSRRLSSRITYLLESLAVLEFDPQAGQALIRSHKPTVHQQLASFYEVLLELSLAGCLTLRRYENNKTLQQRTLVSLCLTREVLLRLAEDLVETAPTP